MSWIPSVARQLVTNGPRAAGGAVVLGYHDVVTGRPTTYQVDAAQLDRQLRLLAKLGMNFVTASELIDRLLSGRSIERCAVVTFDDALLGVHRNARAVLRRYRIAATIFAVSGHLGTNPEWWEGQQPTMTARQLLELVEDGHEIGSHTVGHPSLASLGADQMMTELSASRAALRDLTGQPVDLLAYPSGHHNPSVRAAAESVGYRAGFTFLNGRVEGSTDRFRLPRLTMGPHLSTTRLAAQLLRAPSSWPDHQVEFVGPQ